VIEEWAGVVGRLKENQVLWVDLVDASEEDERAVRDGLELDDASFEAKAVAVQPELELAEGHIRVTAVAVSDAEKETAGEVVPIDCLIGANWVLTSRVSEVPVIEDFRARAEGAGELGALDAPSFVATLLEWVVTSYTRAFSEIESTLEEFDISVLTSPNRNTEQQVLELVETRRSINKLRRSLWPHREIFATLSHAELDPVSTELSAERFQKLTEQTDAALASATEAKNAVVNSFDVLILRTEHRTNEIMKVLTLASILLLPGALIAGVMGMNVNFAAGTFSGSPLFWTVIALIAGIALATLGIARLRRWI
jgi:magnesium transporter